MALRVLLADESSTIKKVFQLALQDFAVDVRPVNVGLDVASVARTFKPDIVFADVILQKKNGYDVSAQLKGDPELKDIPVILMWSGFMELDEDKFQASRADAKLEKPFDVAALRSLVNEWVPKTQSSRLSQFLSFPKMPDFKEEPKKDAEVEVEPQTASKSFSSEDFTQVPLPKINKGKEKFRVDLQPTDDVDEVPVNYQSHSEKIEVESLLSSEGEPEEFSIRTPKKTPVPATASFAQDDIATDGAIEISDLEDPPELTSLKRAMTHSSPPPIAATAAVPQLSEEQLIEIIRQQSQEVIESVVWKIVPDLATQIIERELSRLLREREA